LNSERSSRFAMTRESFIVPQSVVR